MPVLLFPSIGSSSAIPGTQVSSSLQLQQRDHNSLEERQKASAALPSYMKPVLSPVAQPPVVPPTDAAGIQKVCIAILSQLPVILYFHAHVIRCK